MLRYKAIRAGLIVGIMFGLLWGFFELFPPKETPVDPIAEIQRCSYWKTVTPTLTAQQREEVKCFWKTINLATPIGKSR